MFKDPLADGDAVHIRAIGASEVVQRIPARRQADRAVTTRHQVIRDTEAAARVATDCYFREVDGEGFTAQGTRENHQLRGHGHLLSTSKTTAELPTPSVQRLSDRQ